MQIKYGLNPPPTSSNLLRKLLALVITVAMLGLVLMFSAVLLVIIFVVGTLGWAYLWWKTRELRKQMRSFQQQGAAAAQQTNPNGDDVFEGEVIRVVEPPDGK
jgi:hypothetical protein